MMDAIAPLERFIVTPTVCKHRVFTWLVSPTEPDHQLYVFARNDDYFFGIFQSKPHELWALRAGPRLETRPRYTPTTCFDTFPFPEPTETQRLAIGVAVAELDRLRYIWLNVPEWTRTEVLEFPGSSDGPWGRLVHEPNENGIGTVRYARTVAKDAECAKELKKRTLTNLYNQRPTWLAGAPHKLDAAVFGAYGWSSEMSDEQILAELLDLNLQRAGGAAPMPRTL